MYPTFISRPFARRGVTVFLLLLGVVSVLALSGCDVVAESRESQSGPSSNADAEREEGDANGAALSRQTSGVADGEGLPQDMPLDLSIQYQWVGQFVLSELRGIELATACGSWAVTFASTEVESKAANNAGLDVTVWGFAKGFEEDGARQVIAVESVFVSGDPMPKILVPSYPCSDPIDDYPYPGPIEIDLLPGEIAAVGKLVRTDDGTVYLETESGRILLRLPEIVPPVPCYTSGAEPSVQPSVSEDAPGVECVVIDPVYPVDPTTLGDLPIHDQALPEPGAGSSGGGVDGYVGSGDTISGGAAPSTVDSGPVMVGEGETIAVGTWSLENGQLVIEVRYLLDRSYVYPRPVLPPDPGPMPPPTEIGDAGYVTGRVAIGPLCPVEPCSDESTDIYSRHVVLLESESGEIIEVPLTEDGYFKAEVKPGTYVVSLSDCEYMGCDYALPVKVEVAAGTVEYLEIDIDTGIR